jgi:hypothetical protein
MIVYRLHCYSSATVATLRSGSAYSWTSELVLRMGVRIPIGGNILIETVIESILLSLS